MLEWSLKEVVFTKLTPELLHQLQKVKQMQLKRIVSLRLKLKVNLRQKVQSNFNCGEVVYLLQFPHHVFHLSLNQSHRL